MDCSVFFHHHNDTFPFPKALTYRLPDSETVFRVGDDAINHNFDVVNLVTVDLHLGRYLFQLTIYTHSGIARLPYLLKKFAVMTLTALDQRSQQYKLLTLQVVDYGIENLIFRLPDHAITGKV